MFRPTRSIIIVVAVFLLIFSLSFLDKSIQSWTHNRYSIISAPIHEPTSPPPKIVDFWEKWANVFDKAKPQIKKIELTTGVSVDGSDKANGDRVPSQQSIGIPEKDVESLHQSHMKLVDHADFKAINTQASTLFSGAGVVMVGGGSYMPPALLSIRMLRKVNNTLPVHVFLPSKHDYEPEICEEVLPAMGAQCFLIEDHLRKDNPVKVDHYQLKVMAILFSSFETVVYLDSDCMLLHDPMELIETEPFISTGMLNWPDYWISTEDPVFYTIAGLKEFPKGLPGRSSEAGQMLISKKKHLDSLLLAAYYNVYGPDYYYPLQSQNAPGQGDKETFLAAAVVLGNPYYRVKEHVGTVGYFDKDSSFHGGAMVQFDAAEEYKSRNVTDASKKKKSRPFFLHANVPKMNVGRLLDEGIVHIQETGEKIRLWGKEESTRAMFGIDIERFVWNEMRELACQLEGTLNDFKGRWELCARAQEHYRTTFEMKIGGGV